ncbi:fimbrial protein pilin [Caballeronia peredens]|nr:fimbrial protein pilin [Caballeronia peredens]
MKKTKLNIRRAATKGFTLIELMITVAIVGILAFVALPAYQDYNIRGQVSEGLVLAEGVKVAIAEYYAQHGTFPTTAPQVAVDMPAGNYAKVQSIQGQGAVVIIYTQSGASSKLKNPLGGTKGIVFVPQDDGNGNLKWLCGGMNMPAKWMPSSCQDNVAGLY